MILPFYSPCPATLSLTHSVCCVPCVLQLEYRPPAVLSEGLSLEALAQEQSGQYLHHLRQQLQQTNVSTI